MARRLVERGVPFVEVTLDGWDTHANNFDGVKNLCGVLDPAWATLMGDLKDRGLLDSTLIMCMGEFGRTPKINRKKAATIFRRLEHRPGRRRHRGRPCHRPHQQGRIESRGRPGRVPDLLATVCQALGIDREKQNPSNVGRPIRIVDKIGVPIREVLA